MRIVASCFVLVAMLAIGCDGNGGGGTGGAGGNGKGGGGNGAGAGGTGAAGGGTGAGEQGGGGSGTGAGSQGGGGGGTGKNSGDCDTDADCGGGQCVEISPGGFRVCKATFEEAMNCVSMDFDQCCQTSDCDPGFTCFPWPATPYCGGAAPIEHNECMKDQCTSDAECGGGICAPTGTMANKVRVCVQASCKLDTDCTAENGGICPVVYGSCCQEPVGLFCVYPGNGCRKNSDCGPNEICLVKPDGTARCEVGEPLCPP